MSIYDQRRDGGIYGRAVTVHQPRQSEMRTRAEIEAEAIARQAEVDAVRFGPKWIEAGRERMAQMRGSVDE